MPGGAWCSSPRKTGPVAGAARLGSTMVEEAPVLWAALGFWGAAKWSEGISGPPHWLGTNWRGGSGGRQGRAAHPGHSRPFSLLCILRVPPGLREPEKTPSLWGDFLELVPLREPQEHRGYRGPHPRSQGRCAETDGSGTAPVSMTVPWKQTQRRVRPQEMGRAFPGQTQGGGALRPGTAKPILSAGDRCTPRPRRAGRGLPLKQAPPLPGLGDGRAAHLVSSPHSFHWRLPREGPRLLPSAAPTPQRTEISHPTV